MGGSGFEPSSTTNNGQPLTTPRFSFNETNLAIRSHPASDIKSSSLQLQSRNHNQLVETSATDPETNNLSVLHTAFNPLDIQPSLSTNDLSVFERMSVATTFKRMGEGNQTATDIEYFHKNNRFPARSPEGVEMNVQFTINPQFGCAMYCLQSPMTIPAEKCNTYDSLFKTTKDHWREVYSVLGLSYPKNGILQKDLKVWVVETHGDARSVWTMAYSYRRYAQFYRDHVIHGRTARLLIHMMHNEPVEG